MYAFSQESVFHRLERERLPPNKNKMLQSYKNVFRHLKIFGSYTRSFTAVRSRWSELPMKSLFITLLDSFVLALNVAAGPYPAIVRADISMSYWVYGVKS